MKLLSSIHSVRQKWVGVVCLGLASLGGCAHKPEVVPVSQPLPKHAHSCESARFLFEPDQVLATGANLLVTGNEINEEIADAADQAWRSYCRKIQQLRQEAQNPGQDLHPGEPQRMKNAWPDPCRYNRL